MLSIYVDDFKLAGKKAHLPTGWKMRMQGIQVKPEQRVDATGAVYLGCRHLVSSIKLPLGRIATTMTYDVEDLLKSCKQRYLEVAGKQVTLRNYATPFLTEDHRGSPASGLAKGLVRVCP